MNKYLYIAKLKWNDKADEFNRWDSLDSDEKFELFWDIAGVCLFDSSPDEIAKAAWDSAIEEYSNNEKTN